MARKSNADLRRQRSRESRYRGSQARPKNHMIVEHINTPSEERCPEPCGKVIADSEKHAWALAAHYLALKGGEPARRVYPCSQTPGAFHWTRML